MSNSGILTIGLHTANEGGGDMKRHLLAIALTAILLPTCVLGEEQLSPQQQKALDEARLRLWAEERAKHERDAEDEKSLPAVTACVKRFGRVDAEGFDECVRRARGLE
jgi:hypothetical protein